MPYYAVYKGNFGSKVYNNWPDAEKAAKWAKGGKVKRFDTQADAEQFLVDPSYVAPPPTEPIEVIRVFTDGSATLATGTAGIGVHFPDFPAYDLSEPFNQPPNTNQRAELYAAIRALQQIKARTFDAQKQLIYLYTDSKYVINSATTWRTGWERSDFRQNTIANQGLIKQLWAEIDSTPYPLRFEWVRGHADSAGNIVADALAGAANH